MWLSSYLKFCLVILLHCSTFVLRQVTKYWSVFFLFYFLGGFSGFHCKNDTLFRSAVRFLERCVFVEPFLES